MQVSDTQHFRCPLSSLPFARLSAARIAFESFQVFVQLPRDQVRQCLGTN